MNGRGQDGDHLYNSVPRPPCGSASSPAPRVELGNGSGSRSSRPSRPARPGTRNTCTVDGCDGRVHAHGLCGGHYTRWYIHDDLRESEPLAYNGPPTPLVCDCHTPEPTPSDECSRCHRVIAELVHQRRRPPC